MGEVYINPSPPAVSQCWEAARKAGRVVKQAGVKIHALLQLDFIKALSGWESVGRTTGFQTFILCSIKL